MFMTWLGSKKKPSRAGRMPNFLVIGAGKSGTTSLYHYLKQHPQIYMSPVKEPKYFALAGQRPDYKGPGDQRIVEDAATTREQYLALFGRVTDERAVGEATTIYLNDARAHRRMADEIPGARIVAILRHPADRAYSEYKHMRCAGWEPLAAFEDALEAEPSRIRAGYYYRWQYRTRGYYGRDLASYFERFAREQIRVYLYEDFCERPFQLLADLFGFLGVDTAFAPDISARHNQSGIPRSRAVQNFLTRSHPIKTAIKALIPEHVGHRLIARVQSLNFSTPTLPAPVRARLTADYREDILRLQDLIGRDLGHWV